MALVASEPNWDSCQWDPWLELDWAGRALVVMSFIEKVPLVTINGRRGALLFIIYYLFAVEPSISQPPFC